MGTLRGGGVGNLRSGTAFQANYAHRVAGSGPLRVSLGVNLLANPQRQVRSQIPISIRDVATLYLTPEVRIAASAGPLEPYVFGGGGWALYEHSRLTQSGAENPGPRTAGTGAVTYGGGLDVVLRRWLALRGEVRDTYTGAPRYNFGAGRQHNVSITGGFVLRWGR